MEWKILADIMSFWQDKRSNASICGYKHPPRKPRPLVAGINWQKIFKKRLIGNVGAETIKKYIED